MKGEKERGGKKEETVGGRGGKARVSHKFFEGERCKKRERGAAKRRRECPFS